MFAVEDSGGGLEPAAAEGVFGGQEVEGLGVECSEFGWGVEGEGLELPLRVGWGGGFLVQGDCSLREECGGGLFAGAVGEELREYSAFEDLSKDLGLVALEAD